ncbi:MAG: Cna B-type domain-containing protein, partial [Ruminococcus sp.]|nr:Cna B-type domain-containing protein [Ruminococcus sp.]
SSTDTSITNGNSSYSFANIEYYVSKSKTDFNTSGSNYLGYIRLNAAGEGHSKDGSRATLRFLPPGTYYVKEGYVPSGSSYEKNDTVYTVTVTKNHTTTAPLVLRVSDTPKTCYGKIVKASTRPEITNGNPDYSMEGIRYSFSKSKTDFSPSGSNYIGYVQLDENGVGYTAEGSRATLRNLVPGTYYVKESVIPAGCKYKMDNTVYTMTFTFDNDKNHLKVLNVKDEPEGSSSAKVIKKTSWPEFTDGNPLYSFEGAEFTFYKTQADAEQETNAYTTVTTDENGVALVSDIELGTFYVKETKAPENFERSDEIKELVIDTAQDEAYEVEFEDKPIVANLSVLLQKMNADTGADADTDMSGAEYTFKYYADHIDEDQVSEATPTRTWVLVTDENNLCKYDSEHYVYGDALYKDADGNYVLPFGTLTIQETKAPDDFYLDETVYYRQITKDCAENVTQYNLPISTEHEIQRVSFSGEKTWDDDDNRDGKRPKSITVELYRDDELIDSATMSEETGWKYEFADLPKGYADLSLDEHIYFYRYEVKEGAVQYYESESSGVDADPDDDNHLICDFTNHYTPEKVTVSGTKSWDDYNDLMGYRPKQIKVILNRDGVKLDEITTSENEDWSYEFTNLYKYHDGGKKYTYTVTEEPVPGYMLKVDGFNMKNKLNAGSVTLNKTDGKGEPMQGVTFKLFTESGKPVKSSSNGTKYKFYDLSENEDDAVYTTNENGQIIVENLPVGKYYFEESKTAIGFIPYGEKLSFEIDGDNDASLNVSLDVENAKAVMPETGGIGNGIFGFASAMLAVLAAILLCTLPNKSKRKVENQ